MGGLAHAWSREYMMHGLVLHGGTGLQFGVGACNLCVFPALWHGPDAQAQVRGHQAWHQQDAEQYDQRRGETDGGHADHGRWIDGPGGEHHCRRVVGVLQGECQISGGHHLDDSVDAYLLLVADRSSVEPLPDAPLVPGTGRTDSGVHIQRGGRWTVLRWRVLYGRVMSGQQAAVLCGQDGVRVRTLVRALVPADLYGALEVHFHRIRELERLEVRVRQHGRAGAEVLDFREPGHEFATGHAALLVYQLDGCPFAIVGHAVSHEHVKFGVIVLDRKHHGHSLSNLHEPGNFGSPRSFSDL